MHSSGFPTFNIYLYFQVSSRDTLHRAVECVCTRDTSILKAGKEGILCIGTGSMTNEIIAMPESRQQTFSPYERLPRGEVLHNFQYGGSCQYLGLNILR